MKKITLYSLSTCPVCRKVRKFLDENSVEYTLVEVDTLEGGEQWVMSKELSRHNPAGTYPTVVIEESVVGFDPDALREKIF